MSPIALHLTSLLSRINNWAMKEITFYLPMDLCPTVHLVPPVLNIKEKKGNRSFIFNDNLIKKLNYWIKCIIQCIKKLLFNICNMQFQLHNRTVNQFAVQVCMHKKNPPPSLVKKSMKKKKQHKWTHGHSQSQDYTERGGFKIIPLKFESTIF